MRPLSVSLLQPRRRAILRGLAFLLAGLACTLWLVSNERALTREEFETQSRILHRLLTQRAEQHEALFAALLALEPALPRMGPDALPTFVASVIAPYPQVSAVHRYVRNAAGQWGGVEAQSLRDSLALALRDGQAVQAEPEGFVILRRGTTNSVWALSIRTDRLLGPDEQVPPAMSLRLAPDVGPATGVMLMQRVALEPAWRALKPLHFEKHLGVRSQAWLMTTEQGPLPAQLPWWKFLRGYLLVYGCFLTASFALNEYLKRVLAQRQLALAHASRINAMGEVAAGMAHELNQPLAAILSNAQAAARWLADDPPEVSEARSAVGAAVTQAKRAGEILHRLRSFISPQAGVSERVDLNEVAQSALLLVGESLQRRNVQISTRLAEGLPGVRGERVAFEQVVVNLLLNAADALQAQDVAQRRLQVETSIEQGRVVLAVRDSGPGLTPEVKARLFEPFFTTKPEGMGLGLSICEHIVQQAGGDLAADNAEGGGAVFSMRLPVSQQSQQTGTPA